MLSQFCDEKIVCTVRSFSLYLALAIFTFSFVFSIGLEWNRSGLVGCIVKGGLGGIWVKNFDNLKHSGVRKIIAECCGKENRVAVLPVTHGSLVSCFMLCEVRIGVGEESLSSELIRSWSI